MAQSRTLFQLLRAWGSAQRLPCFSSVLLQRVKNSISWHCRASKASRMLLTPNVQEVTGAVHMELRGVPLN